MSCWRRSAFSTMSASRDRNPSPTSPTKSGVGRAADRAAEHTRRTTRAMTPPAHRANTYTTGRIVARRSSLVQAAFPRNHEADARRSQDSPPLGRIFHRQYARKPARCQRTTVAGWTITSACCHFGQSRRSATHSIRSGLVIRDRFLCRWSTASWWRSAMISNERVSRDRKSDKMKWDRATKTAGMGRCLIA